MCLTEEGPTDERRATLCPSNRFLASDSSEALLKLSLIAVKSLQGEARTRKIVSADEKNEDYGGMSCAPTKPPHLYTPLFQKINRQLFPCSSGGTWSRGLSLLATVRVARFWGRFEPPDCPWLSPHGGGDIIIIMGCRECGTSRAQR